MGLPTTGAGWKTLGLAVAERALKTLLYTFLGAFPAGLLLNQLNWPVVGWTVATATVLSVIGSLLSALDDGQPSLGSVEVLPATTSGTDGTPSPGRDETFPRRAEHPGGGVSLRVIAGGVAAALICAGLAIVPAYPTRAVAATPVAPGLVYQLSSYQDGRLDAIAAEKAGTVVIDLARDGSTGYWTAGEIARLKASGKRVLAYMEIGAIEDYRPEWPLVVEKGLAAGPVQGWPQERYGRFWTDDWYRIVVKSRILRAAALGFDGVYLDEVVAYEEIPDRVLREAGLTRQDAAGWMVALLYRIRHDLDKARPGLLVIPQNSPELRTIPGYLDSIDGIGMEDLFYTDNRRCSQAWCQDNLLHALAIRDAGKLVYAIDYTSDPRQRALACTEYRGYRFTGVVTRRAVDTIPQQCH